MSRTLLALAIAVLICGPAAGSAQAGPLRVRADPNDSTSKLDIRKVVTRLSATTMYLRLTSWDRFRLTEMREVWVFDLDTAGTPQFDRRVVMYPSRHGLKCEVRKESHGYQLLGTRHGSRP